MAKEIIEKAPFNFNFSLYDFQKNLHYIQRYKAEDNKGRYLYWDKFRWRVDKNDDPLIAWWATKLSRLSLYKIISYQDKHHKDFMFCTPDTLQAKLHKITQFSAEGLAPVNSVKRNYLIASLVIEEAISSSQLEGASTTRRVAKEMLVSSRTPKTEDEKMILNNYLLMREVKEVKDEELSIDMILEFHKIATKGTIQNGVIPGELRQDNEIVITDGVDGNIVHQPPCHTEVENRLRDVCDFANTNHSGEDGTMFIHPILKGIILHFMIGYEHPFADGNGRTARAIFYWFMLKNKYDYFEYISISKLLKEAPVKYGKSYLYTEIDENDLTYFIYYQVDIILRAIDELLKYLQEKSKEFEEMTTLLEGSMLGEQLNFIQKDIVKKAIKHPGRVFTANELAVDYAISANTARKYLNIMNEEKILKSYKEGRTTAYIAPANLYEILKQ
ncbi:MAG: MloA [uncultured Sulfurovum sp.]|uniref:MloA n=1 Tax=uncultured Sulfurovum sp. TaxID=269237 RepID=A0A6S6UEH6_9BACT|nr:MAG: MloA [uncultured Sulfurovum sp.]